MLQDVEHHDRRHRSVLEGEGLGRRHLEVKVRSRPPRCFEGARADIDTVDAQLGAAFRDRTGNVAGAAPDVEHIPVNPFERVEQEAELEPLDVPGPRLDSSRTPNFGLVVEGRIFDHARAAFVAAAQSAAAGLGMSTRYKT